MRFIYFTFIIFLSFCSEIQNLNAQGPGYMGKHFYVSAEWQPRFKIVNSRGYYIGGFIGTETNEMGVDIGDSYVTHRFGLSANYVVSTSAVLGVFAALNPQYHFSYEDDENNKDLIKSRGLTLGLSLKTFSFKRKGFIAPNGRFLELRPFVVINKLQRTGSFDRQFSNEVFVPLPTPEDLISNKYNTYGLSFYWGQQTVSFDRLLPNISTGFSVYRAIFPLTTSNDISQAHLLIDDYKADGRIGISYKLEVIIGLGGLIF